MEKQKTGDVWVIFHTNFVSKIPPKTFKNNTSVFQPEFTLQKIGPAGANFITYFHILGYSKNLETF